MISPPDLIAEARTWLNVPFHHQGTTKDGCDCIGLIVGLCNSLNLLPKSFESIPYSREPNAEVLLSEIERYATPVNPADLRPGHVLVFCIRHRPRHFALATHIASIDALGILHAYNGPDGAGSVCEHILDGQFWKPRIVAAFEVPGVDYSA